MKFLKSIIINISSFCIAFIFAPIIFFAALGIRIFGNKIKDKPRLVWGSDPILNNHYWSRAMKELSFKSQTFTTDFYDSINKRGDWDLILSEKYVGVLSIVKPYLAFLFSMFKYDLFFISFNGYFIGQTPLKYLQAFFLKLANKKIVVIAYGGDSYIYNRIRSVSIIHALQMSYPKASRNQVEISTNVDYWVKNADAILPSFMGPDGFGRWDILIPSTLFIDIYKWEPSSRNSIANGSNKSVIIAHAPNHRGFKGTEFIIDTIKKLQKEGLKVELKLIEKVQNDEVRRILQNDVDILIEQLIFNGHGLNGIEGMASGITTISNLESETYIRPFRRWSYFGECPLVSATPENLIDVLRKLINNPDLRKELGIAGRKYIEKYHGIDSAQYLFTNVIDYVYDKKDSLINLYHPILGLYPNRIPKIQHPLYENKII